MPTAESYLETLQGLLLFMHTQRGTLPSLKQLEQLDPEVRAQLECDFRESFDEVVEDARRREAIAMEGLMKLIEQHQRLQAPFLAEGENYLDDLPIIPQRKKPTVFQDGMTYEIIIGLAERILKVAKKLKFVIPEKIVFGSLHTERFNACAIHLPAVNEHLIVFESQLFFFLNRMSKVIAQCLVFQGLEDEHWKFSTKPEDMIKQIQENQLIQDGFNRLMIAFVFEGNVKATPNIIIPLPQQQIQIPLLQSMELFIMAHEYTHVVKHHYKSGKHSFMQLNNIDAEEQVPAWEKELEADGFGILLAAGAMNDYGFQEDFCLVGPDVFFVLSEIVESAMALKYGETLANRKQTSHPPSSARRVNIRKALAMSFSPEQMDIASYLPEVFSALLGYLWEHCAPIITALAQ